MLVLVAYSGPCSSSLSFDRQSTKVKPTEEVVKALLITSFSAECRLPSVTTRSSLLRPRTDKKESTVKLKSNVEVYYPQKLYGNAKKPVSQPSPPSTAGKSATLLEPDSTVKFGFRKRAAKMIVSSGFHSKEHIPPPPPDRPRRSVHAPPSAAASVHPPNPTNPTPTRRKRPSPNSEGAGYGQRAAEKEIGFAQSIHQSTARARNQSSGTGQSINQPNACIRPVSPVDQDIPADMREAGWTIQKSKNTGKNYFFNKNTRISSYTMPEEFDGSVSPVSPTCSLSDSETPLPKTPRRSFGQKRKALLNHDKTAADSRGKSYFVSSALSPISQSMGAASVSAPPVSVSHQVAVVNEMDIDVEMPPCGPEAAPVSYSGVPMDVDATVNTVNNLRLREDYLGIIPPVSFDFPDVEMAPAVKPLRCLILDTNIIVGKEWAKFLDFMVVKAPALADVQVKIPHAVMLELDGLKAKRGDPVFRAANSASRQINERFRAQDRRFVGQTVREYQDSRAIFTPKTNDDCILACCLQAEKSFPGAVFFVTDDRNLQTRTAIQGSIQILTGTELTNAMQNFLTGGTVPSVPIAPQHPDEVRAAGVFRELFKCVDTVLLKILSDFLQQRLIQVFGDLWRDISSDSLPPWPNLTTVVNLIQRRQSAAFIDVFRKREDITLFTDLISSDFTGWTSLRSAEDEILRLGHFLKKAILVTDFIDQLEKAITAPYENILRVARFCLNDWETKRGAVLGRLVGVEVLESEVTKFLDSCPRTV